VSHADYSAPGEVPVSKTANEVIDERNKGFWWKHFIRPQNSVKVVR